MKVKATLIGFSAILMWSLLALFTAASGTMPPFQLSAICFSIGSLPGIIVLALKPERLALLKQPGKVWIVGIAGLFGYHFLYFTALRNAPAVEAGLIAYLWPLLIVVGSALLPGERLRWYHIAGALCGLAGTILIVARNGVQFDEAYAMGYGAALACAFTWSGYSLLTRRLQASGSCPSGPHSTPGTTASRTAIYKSSASPAMRRRCFPRSSSSCSALPSRPGALRSPACS
jgi:drug/metabolite transporter (DMT)-like permease